MAPSIALRSAKSNQRMERVERMTRPRARIDGFDQLVGICAYAFDDTLTVPVPASPAECERLVRLAQRHRVQGLVAAALGEQTPEPLRVQARAIAVHNLHAAAESHRLLEAFTKAGIDLLFFKGLTLGALAWPKPMAKMSWDIDVLVNPDSLIGAAGLLERLGYRRHRPAPAADLPAWHRHTKESEWSLDLAGLQLELHSRPTENMALLPSIGLDSPRQLVAVKGGAILPTLAPSPLFAYLCVHGATSAWFRLKWLADLAALIHRTSAEQTAAWINEAAASTHPRIVGQAMLLTERLFGPMIPADFVAPFEADAATRWLADVAEVELAGPRSMVEPTERRLGTLRIHASQLRLRPGLGFKAGEAWRQVRESIGR